MPLDNLADWISRDVPDPPVVLRQVSPVIGTGAFIVRFGAIVPGGKLWELVTVAFTLATSATVANRLPRLNVQQSVTPGNQSPVDDQAITLGVFAPTAVQTATQTVTYTFAAGSGAAAAIPASGVSTVPIPPLVLPAAHVVNLSVSGAQATDTITGAVLWVVETTVGHESLSAEYAGWSRDHRGRGIRYVDDELEALLWDAHRGNI